MKRRNFSRFMPYVLSAGLLTLTACGDWDGDDDDNDAPAAPQEEQTPTTGTQDDTGTFRATLTPVNSNALNSPEGNNGTGGATGCSVTTPENQDSAVEEAINELFPDRERERERDPSANNCDPGAVVAVSIQGDEFTAAVAARGVPRVTGNGHPQHIHVGTTCPTAANDTNGDGWIDGPEAGAVHGAAILPFDSDINGQEAGAGDYPNSTDTGLYAYREQGSYSQILADLTAPDTNTSDALVKLEAGSLLGLEGRVVEIHGVPESVELPATVAALPGLTPHQSLPIACGVLQRVTTGI